MEFLSLKKEENKILIWCTTNDPKVFVNFTQYLIDNVKGLEDFVLHDTESNSYYNFLDFTNQYGMRKRTFHERLDGIATGTLKETLDKSIRNKEAHGMEQKLKEYGFADFTIDKLMTGKVALVSYGKVKLNKRLNRLITYYPNGKIKEEQI